VKKFELHLDAIIVVVAVFTLAIAFLLYQRHQYSIVMQENIDLVWENSKLEADIGLMSSQWNKCKSAIDSMKKTNTNDEQSSALE
jgi:hypothetical protein